MHRWLRVLVCLLLVCCILVNLSPLRVKAVDAFTVVGVGAGLAVTAALIGLGLQAGSTRQALQEISSSAVSAIESGALGEFISDGMVNAVKYQRADGKYGFALSLGLLEALKNWIFGDGNVLVSDNTPLINYHDGDSITWIGTYSNYNINIAHDAYIFIISDYLGSSGNNILCAVWTGGNYLGYSNYGYGTSMSGEETGLFGSYQYFTSSGTSLSNLPSLPIYPYKYYSNAKHLIAHILNGDISPVDASISTSYDLTLGNVGTADQTVEEAHSDWVAGSITVPGSLVGSDTEEKYVPVGLPADQTEALGKTQEEVQSGVGTYDDTIADTETDSDAVTGTGTIADVIAEIKAIPTTISEAVAQAIAAVQAIPQAITDFFIPSTNILTYLAIPFSEYFPFCIPFDLYDFVTCLNTDPVAPVVDWEIYLPGGSSIPLEIDLSPFEEVARILRTLELLLFCIGLAVKTRDLIKG